MLVGDIYASALPLFEAHCVKKGGATFRRVSFANILGARGLAPRMVAAAQ
jgi:hypothetical protein